MKKISLLLIWLLCGTSLMAQNDAMLTQQWFSRINCNPAATGNTNDVDVFLLHRSQWNGVEDAPQTSMLNVHNYFDKVNSGVGLSLSYDKEGAAHRNLNAKLAYAYHLRLDDKSLLAFGLGVGLQNRRVDYNKLTTLNPNDPTLMGKGKESKTGIDFDFGVEYALQRLTVGASVTHIGRTDNDKLTTFKNGQQIYAYVRYRFTIIDALDIAPNLVYVYGNHTDLWELGATAFLAKRFWVGAAYRHDVAVCFMAGLEYNIFRVGYAYDSYIKDTRDLGSGTNEFMLSVRIPKSKREKVERIVSE